MDKRTCNDALTKIDAEIIRVQNQIINLEKTPGNNTAKIIQLEKDLYDLELQRKTWKGSLCACTY